MTAPVIPLEAVKNGETNFQVAGWSDKALGLLHFLVLLSLSYSGVTESFQLLISRLLVFFPAYLMRFVVAANLLGFPAISVPVSNV